MFIAWKVWADLRGNVANCRYSCAVTPVLGWEHWEVCCRVRQGFLLDIVLYQVMCPGPGSFCGAACTAFTDSDPRRAVLHLLAANLG